MYIGTYLSRGFGWIHFVMEIWHHQHHGKWPFSTYQTTSDHPISINITSNLYSISTNINSNHIIRCSSTNHHSNNCWNKKSSSSFNRMSKCSTSWMTKMWSIYHDGDEYDLRDGDNITITTNTTSTTSTTTPNPIKSSNLKIWNGILWKWEIPFISSWIIAIVAIMRLIKMKMDFHLEKMKMDIFYFKYHNNNTRTTYLWKKKIYFMVLWGREKVELCCMVMVVYAQTLSND